MGREDYLCPSTENRTLRFITTEVHDYIYTSGTLLRNVFTTTIDGTAVASYTYDPYGDILTATGELAEVNPLRYRGYYYDEESGFYYLSSRYYDPETGWFINADSALPESGTSIFGHNMFAYCFNNPVNMVDLTGNWPEWIHTALKVVAGTAVVAAGRLVYSLLLLKAM